MWRWDVKSLLSVLVAGALLGTIFVSSAEAGDGRRGPKHRRHDARYEYRDGRYDGRYFRSRDVVVIRDYYRPYHRPLPRSRFVYARGGYLPPGWGRRIRPVPVYVERDLVVVPRGYRRGVIDGRAVVYNSSGLIIDVAVLF
jgi:hypothetical protein